MEEGIRGRKRKEKEGRRKWEGKEEEGTGRQRAGSRSHSDHYLELYDLRREQN